jgi:putative tricarboxylic transport membrane protein
MVANFTLVIAALIVYALTLPFVGFFITSMVLLSVLMTAFGAPWKRAVPLAVIVTLLIHYVFYSLLRVALPWGVLEGIAW